MGARPGARGRSGGCHGLGERGGAPLGRRGGRGRGPDPGSGDPERRPARPARRGRLSRPLARLVPRAGRAHGPRHPSAGAHTGSARSAPAVGGRDGAGRAQRRGVAADALALALPVAGDARRAGPEPAGAALWPRRARFRAAGGQPAGDAYPLPAHGGRPHGRLALGLAAQNAPARRPGRGGGCRKRGLGRRARARAALSRLGAGPGRLSPRGGRSGRAARARPTQRGALARGAAPVDHALSHLGTRPLQHLRARGAGPAPAGRARHAHGAPRLGHAGPQGDRDLFQALSGRHARLCGRRAEPDVRVRADRARLSRERSGQGAQPDAAAREQDRGVGARAARAGIPRHQHRGAREPAPLRSRFRDLRLSRLYRGRSCGLRRGGLQDRSAAEPQRGRGGFRSATAADRHDGRGRRRALARARRGGRPDLRRGQGLQREVHRHIGARQGECERGRAARARARAPHRPHPRLRRSRHALP